MIKIFEETADDLTDYAQWFMAAAPTHHRRPVGEVVHYDPATAIVMDRDEQFQVELYTFPAGVDIPAHKHPNVESIEIGICGQLLVFLDGKCVQGPFSMERAAVTFMNRGFRIPANIDHYVSLGPPGGAFFSVQKWLNGKIPTSIGDDWAGGRKYSAAHESRAHEKAI